MTKAQLITEIKKFEQYKETKEYILNKSKKEELIHILEELSGKKVEIIAKSKSVTAKKSTKKDKETVTSAIRSSKDKERLSYGKFAESIKEKLELNENSFNELLGNGYFQKYQNIFNKKLNELNSENTELQKNEAIANKLALTDILTDAYAKQTDINN